MASKEEPPEAKWIYIKNKEVTEEEKILDVFKDDIFLGYLQNLTNCLIIVYEYLEKNIENIKILEKKKKEESLKSLNELNILLNNCLDKNEEGNKTDKRGIQNLLKDQKIIDIINKIKGFDLDILSDLNNNNKDIINNIIKLNNNTPNNNEANKNNLNNDANNNIEKEKQTKNNNNEKNENFIYNLFKNKELNSMQKTFIIDNLNKDDTKSDDEENKFVKEEDTKDKKLLNKKYKKEDESKEKEDSNNSNKKNASSGKKKEQKNNKTQIDIKRAMDNQNQKEIPLNEEIKNLPPLKLVQAKNKEIIEFEIENRELEKNNKNNIGSNNKKKNIQGASEGKLDLLLEKNNNKKDNKKEQLSIEERFGLELKREYCELNPINNKTKIIKSLLSLITTINIQNYNPRISGPYLVGSYSIISELPSINYSTPIDIMYTYKDMLLNNNVIDFTLKNIIETGLNLNIFEKTETLDEENKLTKIKVKCTSKQNISVILSFNIIFVDIKSGFNEKIVNNILFDGEKIKFDKKEDQKKFLTIILYLRTWRRKNNLFFLIPEILDEIARKYLEPNRSMGTTILNVFYDLYNSIIDFNTKKNEGILPKNKSLYENLMKICFQNEYNKEKINKAILAMNKMINEKNFKELFNIEEDEND